MPITVTSKVTYAPLIVLAMFCVANSAFAQSDKHATTSLTLLPSDVEWGALNPARGKLGPRAGNLWGKRTSTDASGFLVKFVDGFKSPPHIHNITYRGVVIRGQVHNDDPEALPMWMPTASYWTQPAGEVHITAAQGKENLVYVEIQKGPYLVLSAQEKNDNGERPLNVHADNIVWLDASMTSWIEGKSESFPPAGPKIAFLWDYPNDEKQRAVLVKLAAGTSAEIHHQESELRCVVIQGTPEYHLDPTATPQSLEPGSYFSSKGENTHYLIADDTLDCILFMRTDSKLRIISE